MLAVGRRILQRWACAIPDIRCLPYSFLRAYSVIFALPARYEMDAHKTFLLVEDNENDAMLLRRAFIKSRLVNSLQVVSSGKEALDYLRGTGRYEKRPPARDQASFSSTCSCPT